MASNCVKQGERRHIRVTRNVMFQTPVVFTAAPFSLVIGLAIVLVLSTVASVYPALKATRQTTAEALASG